jgi:hypothetical protein
MPQENPTWGRARVAAELSVKLGIDVSPRTVRAYWPPEPERRATGGPLRRTGGRLSAITPSPFVACDFLVVTARFRTLLVFLLMEVGTRRPNGALDLAAASRRDSERSFLPFPDP